MFTITSWFCLTRTLTDLLKVLWLLRANVNISEISIYTLCLSLQILTSRNQTLEIRGCCFLWRQHDGTKASVAMRTTKSAKCLMATWSKWSSTQPPEERSIQFNWSNQKPKNLWSFAYCSRFRPFALSLSFICPTILTFKTTVNICRVRRGKLRKSIFNSEKK